MLALATISIMEVTVATSRKRMAAYRARRCKSLLQREVTIAETDLATIASCGYPDVMSDDKVRAVQALSLFINDTVACLDTRPVTGQRCGATEVQRYSPHHRCGATQSSGK